MIGTLDLRDRMFSAIQKRLAIARLGARSLKNTSGASAIEFALVAPIFFVLLFGVIETGIIYLAQSVLQYAANDAARLVRTGKAQTMNSAAFTSAVCNDIQAMLSCNSNLWIDVRTYPSFASATFPAPLNPDGTVNSGMNNYQTGSSGSIELVRVMYTWTVATPLLTPFLTNMANGNHLIIATAAFRNEPF